MHRVSGTFDAACGHATNIGVIILAGGMRPSPLRQQLDIPALCLPMAPHRKLLDCWLDMIDSLCGCVAARIVVSSETDATVIGEAVRERIQDGTLVHDTRVVVEPAMWRGPGGLLYDVAQSLEEDLANGHGAEGDRSDLVVIVGEASCLPPHDLQSLVDRVNDASPGISITSEGGDPAGVYVFTEAAVREIPPVGFYDIKEQLLPALYARGTPIQVVRSGDLCVRVRDRASYLHAARAMSSVCPEVDGTSPDAKVADSAQLAGCCLLESGAIVGPNAIVHESIILNDAVIGYGSVVSQSVVGPGVHVMPGRVVRRQVLGTQAAQRTQRNSATRALSEVFGLKNLFRGEKVQ